MTEAEFWTLTPPEHKALVKQWKEKKNAMALPTAELTVLLINFFKDKTSPPVSPAELLPYPPPRRRMSEAETEAYLDRFFGTTNPNGAKA